MRINYLIVLASMFLLHSCSKELQLEEVSFNVSADSTSYNLGSITTFNFSGKPQFINFYSGEVGQRYEFKDRDTASGTPVLSFSSQMNTGTQPNTMKLMITSDLNGSIDSTSIINASWTDISDRAVWATNTTIRTSGNIDLSDFATLSKPVYIAFKYNAAAGAIQNRWTLTKFSVRNYLSDGTSYVIDSVPTVTTAVNYGSATNLPGWLGQRTAGTTSVLDVRATTIVAGATSAAAATSAVEAWIVTGPVNLKNVTPDAGVSIQTISSFVPFTEYTYSQTGTFEAVFVGSNINVNKQSTSLRKLTVTVK